VLFMRWTVETWLKPGLKRQNSKFRRGLKSLNDFEGLRRGWGVCPPFAPLSFHRMSSA